MPDVFPVGASTARPQSFALLPDFTGAYGIAGSRSDQCPSGALNRTSGPALLAGGHRFARQVLPYAVPKAPFTQGGLSFRAVYILLYQIPRPCATGFERLRGSLLAAAPSPGGRCFDSFQGIVKHTLKLPKHPPAMRIYLKHISFPGRVKYEI